MLRPLRPLLFCLCVAVAASATVEARPAAKRVAFRPDISVSEVKKLVRDDLARFDEFKGNNFYESGSEVPGQNIILDGGKKVTERYLVLFENDGDETGDLRIRIDIPEDVVVVDARDAGATFVVTIYEATRSGAKKIQRGADVTGDFTGNGIVVPMGSGERRYYWVEIVGLKGFRMKDEYVAVPMCARALEGARAEDYFFITFGKAGVVLIPGGGGGTGGGGADSINLGSVNWSAAPVSIASWAATAKVTSITQSKYLICVDSTKKNSWPGAKTPGKGIFVNANLWAIAKLGGIWYAGIIEWIVPGGVCKPLGSGPGKATLLQAMATHWFFPPLRGYVPPIGAELHIGVSAPAWPGQVGIFVKERSNFVKIIAK
ncbi:MAG TPA: hypothetical protein QGG47_03320 [Acidobacteriota bacterium]|nr:hypothetical protein [Acidobacteriota bacterium]